VQQHLTRCVSCRRVAETEGALHGLLAAEAMHEAPPAALAERILQKVRAEAGARAVLPRWPPRFIASTGWLPRGALAGLLLACVVLPGTGGPADAPFADDAVAQHLRDATSATPALGLVTPDASRLGGWLRQRLGFDVDVPPAAGRGERLRGGGVATIADRPAAHVLYEGEGGQRVSLFVARQWSRAPAEESEESIDGVDLYTTTLNGVSLAWWADHGRLYVALAHAGATDLRQLAVLCLRQQRTLSGGVSAGQTDTAVDLRGGPGRGGPGGSLAARVPG